MVRASGNRTIEFIINSPQNKDNLQFSVPHRLLALALRRGALLNETTPEALFAPNGLNEVLVRDEFLDRPLFLRGQPKGIGLVDDEPLKTQALTNYIQIRGHQVGFPTALTWYAIRRRTATDMAAAFGADAARQLMAHDPGTRVLERSYLEFTTTTDVAAAMLREDVEAGTSEMHARQATMAEERLADAQIAKTQGPALNALCEKMIANDPNFPIRGSSKEQKMYRRRIRRVAIATLRDEQHTERRHSQTAAETAARRDAMAQAGAFTQRITQEALRRLGQSVITAPADDMDGADGADDTAFDEDFSETDHHEPAEADIEDQPLPQPGLDGITRVQAQPDEPAMGPTNEPADGPGALTYAWAAQVMIEVLVAHTQGPFRRGKSVKGSHGPMPKVRNRRDPARGRPHAALACLAS